MTGKTPKHATRVPRIFCSPLARGAIFLLAVLGASPAAAKPEIAKICETAALNASRESGVPLSVMRAITLTETGRKSDYGFKPWPWTVNMEGKGVWFDNEDDARAYVYKNYKRGARSFDVGCFQLNYRWHGKAFSSIEEMFDPVANSRYAAKYLLELFAEKGNWTSAAGAYHSRTPSYANKYMARFVRIRENLKIDDQNITPAPTQLAAVNTPDEQPVTAKVNSFPLLLKTENQQTTSTLGSLVPFAAGLGARRLIGGS